MPKVSIIMPAYNAGSYIAQAIQSIQKQTMDDWELHIVNDASTDNTGAVASQYAAIDSRISVLTHARNLGIVATCNDALKQAQGLYTARLDADDAWIEPTKLAQQVVFLDEHPHYGLVGTWAVALRNGQPQYYFRHPTDDAIIRRQLLRRNCFVSSSLLIRTALWKHIGGYHEADAIVEDYGLCVRMGAQAAVANLPILAVGYTVNPSGMSQTKAVAQVESALRIIKRQRNDYPGFRLAWLKWQLQRLLLRWGGAQLMTLIKKVVWR